MLFPRSQVDQLWQQGSGLLNEDRLLAQDNIFGVFDGASSIDGTLYDDGTSGGLLAATQACEVFTLNQGPLPELAALANRLLHSQMVLFDVDITKKWQRWSTSFAVVRIEEHSFDWCQIGDCLIVVIKRDGSHELLVQDPAQDEETFAAWQALAPAAGMNIYEVLRDKIIAVRKKVNRTYGSLNGEAAASRFLRSGRVALDQVAAILLYTDGLFLPSRRETSPEETTSQLVELYHNSGLQGVLNRVRSLQQQDPSCRRYPRFKMHDDVAALALRF